MNLDVVYIVGPQVIANDIELRHSLRSLANLPHRNVWIVGRKPEWVQNVRHISTSQKAHKYVNARNNIVAACEEPEISDQFILMNDDFFVLSPQDEVRLFDRGRLIDVIEQRGNRGNYYRRMLRTLNKLQLAVPNAKCFELHIPTIFDKRLLLGLIENGAITSELLLRTMYFNIYPQESRTRLDVKVSSINAPVPNDYLSTSDSYAKTSWFRAFIRMRFPRPCYYERNDSQALYLPAPKDRPTHPIGQAA
ncbi:MAG: hypothetical protein RLO51_11135 [Thalassobaculum sp.]|uniref:hypothetical protein n=1 Tax=Thalassobaculum sp. TaxID=2022740 RepID=UPI0032EFFE51